MNRAGGFSLIEVVAAFAVLALGLGAVCELLGQAARNATLVRDTAYAITLAEAKLTEIDAAAGEESGVRWRRSVVPLLSSPAEDAGAHWIPCRVSVEVRWGGERNARALSLATIRLRPPS